MRLVWCGVCVAAETVGCTRKASCYSCCCSSLYTTGCLTVGVTTHTVCELPVCFYHYCRWASWLCLAHAYLMASFIFDTARCVICIGLLACGLSVIPPNFNMWSNDSSWYFNVNGGLLNLKHVSFMVSSLIRGNKIGCLVASNSKSNFGYLLIWIKICCSSPWLPLIIVASWSRIDPSPLHYPFCP
jgi:hypothetical protein